MSMTAERSFAEATRMADDVAEDLGHLPDRAKVEALVGFGLQAADIAGIFDIEEERIRTCFPKELAAGEAKANARVAENLYRKATGEGREAVTAAIFWLKTRARWKETSVHEFNGSGAAPMVVVTGVPRHDDVPERTVELRPAASESATK